MNFVPATVEDGGGRLAASGFSLEVPPSLRSATAVRGGGRITIGLRPEDLRDPSLGGASGGATRIPIRVEICEPLGHEVVIHGVSGRDPLVCLHGGFDRLPEVGSRIEVAFDPRRAHLFDVETQLRIAPDTSPA
jgi:multiple sugar transport system ATP-binding protein